MDWMEEFDAFENPENASKGIAGDTGGPKKRNASQIQELEQEMKLLHWHKLANEAALKAALIRTKKLKASSNNPMAAVESRRERAQWMQQIIEEEQNKPLEVNEDFIIQYEKKEREEEERLEDEVQRHIESLQKIKKNLRAKEEVRRRTMIYRDKRKALKASLGNYGSPNDPTSGNGGLPQMILVPDGINPESDNQYAPGAPGAPGMHGTLSKVINSLDKLVDLEKRIARLETDVGPDSPVGDNHAKRTRIKFTKRKAESQGKVPARNIFSVKEVPIGRGKMTGGSGRQARRSRGDTSGASVYADESHISDGTRGRGSKSESRDPVVGNWLEQKATTTRERREVARAKGAPKTFRKRGEKASGPPMQKFSDIRRQFEDRKDKFKRQLNSDSIKPKGGRGRSTSRRSLGSSASSGTTKSRSRSRSQVAQRSQRKRDAWGDQRGPQKGGSKLPTVR